jgi:hypothetical protein
MKSMGVVNHVEITLSHPSCRPDPDYACGAAYCDDPACNTHNPNRPNNEE